MGPRQCLLAPVKPPQIFLQLHSCAELLTVLGDPLPQLPFLLHTWAPRPPRPPCRLWAPPAPALPLCAAPPPPLMCLTELAREGQLLSHFFRPQVESSRARMPPPPLLFLQVPVGCVPRKQGQEVGRGGVGSVHLASPLLDSAYRRPGTMGKGHLSK